MSARRIALGALAVALVAAAPVLASEPAHGGEHGGGHGGGLVDLIWPALNLALLLAVIVYYGRKPIAKYFAERRDGIVQEIDGAATQLSDAEATYAKWQRRLIDLETELEEIRATSRHRAQNERDKIVAEARATAERIRENTRTAIDLELRRAREQLREEATQLAIDLAAERLDREVNDGDRDRLLDEFIDRIARADATGSRAHDRES